MKTVPARNDPRQGEELLELVRKAADPLPAGSVEIQLHSGVLSQGLLDFTLTFDTSLLPVDLELGTCIAQTDDDDNISVDLEMTTWRVPWKKCMHAMNELVLYDVGFSVWLYCM